MHGADALAGQQMFELQSANSCCARWTLTGAPKRYLRCLVGCWTGSTWMISCSLSVSVTSTGVPRLRAFSRAWRRPSKSGLLRLK